MDSEVIVKIKNEKEVIPVTSITSDNHYFDVF